MNKLWIRLTLAFILVTLVGVSTVALLANQSASSQFRRYLARRGTLDWGDLADDLAAYYEQQGGWDGVEIVFEDSQRGQGRGQMRQGGQSALLTDGQGLVVYDSQGRYAGETLDRSEQEVAVPIQAGGQTVGFLLAVPPGWEQLQPQEQSFLVVVTY